MVRNSTKPVKFELTSLRLGAKLDYVVPIINFQELALVLQKSGYNINQVTQPMNFVLIKSANQAYLDGTKGVFGVFAANVDETVSAIEDIFAITHESFGFDLSKYVSFFEFEINATYFMAKDVYVMMANLFQDSSDMKALNKILEGKCAQVSLKLTPSNRNINSLDWFDLTIEPKVNSIGDTFIVRLLYRNRSFRNMIQRVKKTEEIAVSIINKVLVKY